MTPRTKQGYRADRTAVSRVIFWFCAGVLIAPMASGQVVTLSSVSPSPIVVEKDQPWTASFTVTPVITTYFALGYNSCWNGGTWSVTNPSGGTVTPNPNIWGGGRIC